MSLQKPIEVEVNEFTQAVSLLVRRMRAESGDHGLSLSQASVVSRLAKEGPKTIADLARSECVKPQSMGATVGVLEERELVERKPHPTDGRQQIIELTAAGEALRESISNAKRAWLAQAVEQLTDEERDTLFAAGEIVRKLVQRS